MSLIAGPDSKIRLGDFLIENLEKGFNGFQGASAWARLSGVKHLETPIREFAKQGSIKLVIGIDLLGTSIEALEMLLDVVPAPKSLFIFHNPSSPTFHPKVFHFLNDNSSCTYVGSGNLTAGGLFTNYEAGVVVKTKDSKKKNKNFRDQIEDQIDAWTDVTRPTVAELDSALVENLKNEGLIASEAVTVANQHKKTKPKNTKSSTSTFSSEPTKSAPSLPTKATKKTQASALPAKSIASKKTSSSKVNSTTTSSGSYIMTLQQTDVGVGQTSAGKQKRSPEIFIPLVARDQDPAFWGWPNKFIADPSWTGKTDKNGFGKMDRLNVPFLLDNEPIDATFFFNPNKGDLRIRNSALRDAGGVGDLILITKKQTSEGDVYLAEILAQGSPEYQSSIGYCNKAVKKPSLKKFGYY